MRHYNNDLWRSVRQLRDIITTITIGEYFTITATVGHAIAAAAAAGLCAFASVFTIFCTTTATAVVTATIAPLTERHERSNDLSLVVFVERCCSLV